MEENEIMTEAEVMDPIEESEEYTDDSNGFPIIPTVIGGVVLAGATALVVNRKKLGAKIAAMRAEHSKKVLADYEKKSILYEEIENDSEDSE